MQLQRWVGNRKVGEDLCCTGVAMVILDRQRWTAILALSLLVFSWA